jgi:hypothetical protein
VWFDADEFERLLEDAAAPLRAAAPRAGRDRQPPSARAAVAGARVNDNDLATLRVSR